MENDVRRAQVIELGEAAKEYYRVRGIVLDDPSTAADYVASLVERLRAIADDLAGVDDPEVAADCERLRAVAGALASDAADLRLGGWDLVELKYRASLDI